MKKKEKSGGSLRERWVERLAGPASAEEMRMWPLMLRTLALNLRAGIPLQRRCTPTRAPGSSGRVNLCRVRRKCPRRKQPQRKASGFDAHEAPPPSPDDYGQKRCAEDIRRFTQALATVTPGVPPRTSPAPSCSKTAPGCARTATSACTTCS